MKKTTSIKIKTELHKDNSKNFSFVPNEDKIDSSLFFDDLVAIQVIGEDERCLRKNHWLKFQSITKKAVIKIVDVIRNVKKYFFVSIMI